MIRLIMFKEVFKAIQIKKSETFDYAKKSERKQKTKIWRFKMIYLQIFDADDIFNKSKESCNFE